MESNGPAMEKFKLKHIFQFLGIALVLFILINIAYYMYYLLEGVRTDEVLSTYNKISTTKLREFKQTDCLAQYNDKYLADFYIASSAMSFLIGNQRFDYVNTDMIKNCLIMGARYIELQVLNSSFSSSMTRPIITTGYKEGQWQTSLNNIDFEAACNVIAEFAFNPEVKTHEFPLFIYIKLQIDNNPKTLSKMAAIIKRYFPSKTEKDLDIGNRILPDINPAQTKICNLFNQVIIWSDPVQTNGYDEDQQKLILEYQNLINKHPPNRLHFSKLTEFNPMNIKVNQKMPKTPQDYQEESDALSEYNRKNLTIVYPHNDLDTTTTNYDPEEAWSYGCQFVAINYQLNDQYRAVYFDKFKLDSLVLKPNSLQLIVPQPTLMSLDNLPSSKKVVSMDSSRRQMPHYYKNKPVYFRPYSDADKILTIEKNMLVVKDKRNDQVDIVDAFLIEKSLHDPESNTYISLQSVRYPNKYLVFNGGEFEINDWRIKQYDQDATDFMINSTFIPMKGFANTRAQVKEDGSELISFYLQEKKKSVMYYHLLNQNITDVNDNIGDLALSNQSTFYIHKLNVKTLNNIRQSDGFYVHNESTLLTKRYFNLNPNGVFEFIDERDIKNFPLSVGDYIHIKSSNGTYWNIGRNNTLRSNLSTPGLTTRFSIEDKLKHSVIYYEGNRDKTPLIVQKDGILRLAYNSEYEDEKTHFILGTSFIKK
jgi:hypothetical protein